MLLRPNSATRNTAAKFRLPDPPAGLAQELDQAIECLGNPMGDVLDALDATVLLRLLQRVRSRDRIGMLQTLRVPSARLSPRAAEQCLTTLRKRNPEMQQRAAGTISHPTLTALAGAIDDYERHGDDQKLDGAVAAFSESRPELMLAALAFPLFAPGYTALLRHALQRFPMPAWPKDDVQNVIDACAALEGVWRPLLPHAHGASGMEAAPSTACRTGSVAGPWAEGRTPEPADWKRRAEELDELLASARSAASRVATQIDAERAPAQDDLTTIAALCMATLALHEDLRLRASVVPLPDPADVRALSTAANTVAVEQSERARYRAVMLRVAGLQGPPDSAPLVAVREQATRLLDASMTETEHLRLLVELADAHASDDDSAVDDLHALLKEASQDISSVATLILRGKVTAPTASANDTLAPTAGTPASQAAPPPATPAPKPDTDTARVVDGPPVTVTAPDPEEVVPPPAVPTVTASRVVDDKKAAVFVPPAPQPGVSESSVATELIKHLISSGEIALAGHAARADGRVPLQQALATLHLAHCVRSETGPCASAVRERIDEESSHPSGTGQDERMLLLAAALRAALLTADPNAGELVNALSDACAGMAHFQQLCRAVGTASARGQLTAGGGLNVLESVTEADAEVSRASEDARLHLAAPRSLHFPRAEKIVREWWKPDGLIGSLVTAAADDRRDRADHVAAQVRKLTQPVLGKELKAIDSRYRNETKGSVLQGAARRRILEYALESLDIVNTWLLATRAVARGPVLNSVLTNLRHEVRSQAEDAYTELRAHADTASHPLSATIAERVLDSVRTTVRLLDGATLPGTEPAPDQALYADLLRCPELPLTRNLKPSRTVTFDDIERARARSWTEAARGQATAGNFAAARFAVEAAEGESGEDDNSLRDDIEQARGRALADAREAIDGVRSEVATATRQGRLPEPGRSDITARVEAAEADLAGDDFSAVHRQLGEIVKSMPELAEQATADLMQRARGEINNARVGVPDDVMKKITQLVEVRDLATAEDYLLTALTGEHPPTSAPEDDLEHFFPSVPGSLAEGITPELVEAAGNGGAYSGLDFSQLRTRERNTTAETLRSWAQLLRNWRTQKNSNHLLRGALRIAGIEYGSERSVGSYAPNRKWIELTDVQLLGGCRLPAFGSEAGRRLRVLLTPDVSDVTTLTAWADQDTSQLPVLVVVLGTLSATARRELALQTAKQPMKPLLCLDAPALAYLASKASNRFTTTERVLAPFAATNPYRPDANESVPSEMFYGRQQELNDITSTTGAQLLYGGRQLGKSALLRAAARRFETTPGHVALYIPLPTTLGLGQKTDELWDMISRELDRKDIVPSQQARRGTAQQRVTAAITGWLDDDSTRRLLVLFDECDIFFDAEAQESFPQTTRLRELMSTTDRRFKPVFAGLHQVQRFSGLPNQPLYDAHFGKPVVIGPLAPAPAFRLVRQPLEALGIRIPDELVHRILAYCNYHPKLLQLVGQALVRASLNTRVATPPAPGTPPWHIDNAVLERVIGSQDLTDRTRNTINLTLELDPRYKLIALVVAFEAHLDGVDRRITTRVLSKACHDWWPEGFIGQGPDEFRALLEEMTGLGILASDPQGWRLRSSNVLRLLGNQSAIEEALENHDTSKPLTKLTAAQARRPIADVDRVSPLTEQQLARLTAPGNELRIVIGSAATSLDAVIAVLEDQQRRAPSKLDPIVLSTSPSHYRDLLRTGKPGPLHRIVVVKLSRLNDVEKARASLRQVATIQPPSGVTRTVVALADACDGEHRALAAEFDPDNVLIPLRRVTPEGISSWATEVDVLVPFTQTEARNRLMEATGGWPMLLDVALTQAGQGRSVLMICESIHQEVESGALGTRFLDSLGLTTSLDKHWLVTGLVDLNEPLPWDELVEVFQDEHHPELLQVLEELRMLDVLVQDENQLFLLEPTVHRAWPPRPHG
ncbi:hypothetical protein [Streptomyces sp. SHP 1-2]|uniref:hypothetical protein n=1 Tax=Streptomyces sp. SHP 1-2 TaxID=2769489 RepID=UPI0022382E15|nr:hypothetical protein [Streptomyces sp. SHP 1-2]MCW5250267.1 hypothetical protein [Streptomyces sp. SHP 1-2]